MAAAACLTRCEQRLGLFCAYRVGYCDGEERERFLFAYFSM